MLLKYQVVVLKKSTKILEANKNDDLMRFIIILKLLNIQYLVK